MSATPSPNMFLPVPDVGAENGPTYAIDINNSLTIIDQHSHNPGSGVPITPTAININSALSFNSQLATALSGIAFLGQPTPPATSALYVANNASGDLYYNNATGFAIQITNVSGIVGTSGSISGLVSPASASYNSPTFLWRSATGVAANLDAASVLLRNITPNSTYALTLRPPAALGVDYNITLPPLPLSNSFVTIDTAGNMSSLTLTQGITNSMIASTTITGDRLVNKTVTATQIADATITTTQIAASAGILLTQLAFTPHLTSQTFTANGTWTKPAGVTQVLLIGSGGGGGGAGSASANAAVSGGQGGAYGTILVDVSAVSTVSVTIGAGGAGGAIADGGNGGNTTFGALATFKGGAGGNHNHRADSGAGAYGGYMVTDPAGAFFGDPGQSTLQYAGGAAASGGVTQYAGGGGAGYFGPGGNAAAAGATAGAANTGAGGGATWGTGSTAAAGGSGKLIVIWVANT